ncbi:MAG: response regulator transcription factor [Lachnospiraceae bacterium]|nr:response regulator transcription factor [Lachnospiraceae bacterium]
MAKILIIEDEITIAELEKDYLENNQFLVDICYNGEDGLNSAKTDNYDLVILDLMLPDMDGIEVLKELRKDNNVPILVVSAKNTDASKIKALTLEADDYITKPFSPGELVARVRAHISRYKKLTNTNQFNNEVVTVNNLKIDKSAKRIWVNGKEKSFSSKEYDLLLFFVEHPNRVFKKEELYNTIWKMKSVGDIATVTVHIKKIREKIEEDSSNPKYIENIWGVGYRFNA